MIPLFKVAMSLEAVSNSQKVLTSGFIGQGKVVDAFEEDLYYALPTVSRPVSTNSCTSAITLALLLVGAGPGDNVIVSPMTCTASTTPVVLSGADPLYADVDPVTGNMDPESVAKLIDEDTVAIICVDWTGRPPPMAELRKAAGNVPIIRDAAHNPLADTESADYTCFSFGPIKHLCSGDGGALVVHPRRKGDEARARLLRWYGLDRTSTKDFRCGQMIQEAGGKFHMNDINAAIGRGNLPSLTKNMMAHKWNALRLCSFITKNAFKHVTVAPYSANSGYWVFPVLLKPDRRDDFMAHMNESGVMCSRVHSRNDKHPGLNTRWLSNVTNTDLFDDIQANLPCGWWLEPYDLERIEAALTLWEGMENRNGA